MSESTPTPTDPREEEIKGLRAGCEQWRKIANVADAELAEMIANRKELESTNAKLAAEIAELKAARDEANESVTLNYNTILELRRIITEIKAEFDICRSALGIQIHEKIPEQTPKFGSILVDSVGSRRRIAPATENEEKMANELATLRAELEAVNTRYSELAAKRAKTDQLYQLALNNQEDLGKRLEAARKEREQWERSSIAWQENHAKVLERMDALWEELVAQRRLESWVIQLRGRGYIKAADSLIVGFLTDIDKARALTPAPTQEPPAGGVTILKPDVIDYLKSQCNRYVNGMCSTLSCMKRGGFVAGVTCDPDYSRATCQYHEAVCALTPTVSTEGGDPPCAHKEIASQDSSTPTSPDKSENESKTTCASNSPADVPSEGRGELLPFNLADALAGKPVATRDGRKVSGLVERPHATIWGYLDGHWRGWSLRGRYYNSKDTPEDLFMLPTEGSGA